MRAALSLAIFFSLFVSAECATYRKHRTLPDSTHLLVFLHGIAGDETTFGQWPKLTDQDTDERDVGPPLAKYDVGLISYDSKGGSDLTAYQLSQEIRSVLCEQILNTGKEVVVVSHSLGGLLLKKALVDISKDDKCKESLASLKAINFLSTPSDGADVAESAERFVQIVGVMGKAIGDLRPVSSNSFLQELRNDWNNLHDARKLSDYRIFCAFEMQATPWKWLRALFIVPEERIDTRCDSIKGFEKNHWTIAKPATKDDKVYEWVRTRTVDAQRSRATVVLAMDSSPNAYVASLRKDGKSNAFVYQRQLEKLKSDDKLNIQVERETTFKDWNEDQVAFRRNLALIVIHLSAFQFDAQDCFKKKIGMGCSGKTFLPFIRTALRKKIPVIVYSRVNLCSQQNAREFLTEFQSLGGGNAEQLYFVSFEPKPNQATPTYLEPAHWEDLRAVAKDILDPKIRSYSGSQGCNLLKAAGA